MNVKVIIGLCVMVCLVFCSCSQDEVIYSCDKDVDAWIKENLSDIQQMSRNEWNNLDEQVQRGAYVAFTSEQKQIFWMEKLQETLSLDWSDAEKEHIQTLYQTILDNPQWFSLDFSKNEQELEKFEIFKYKWIEYSIDKLSWSDSIIWSIIMTGYKVENMEGSIKMPQNNLLRLKSGTEKKSNCNCHSGNWFFAACGPGFDCESVACEDKVHGCGAMWVESCTGLCGGI